MSDRDAFGQACSVSDQTPESRCRAETRTLERWSLIRTYQRRRLPRFRLGLSFDQWISAEEDLPIYSFSETFTKLDLATGPTGYDLTMLKLLRQDGSESFAAEHQTPITRASLSSEGTTMKRVRLQVGRVNEANWAAKGTSTNTGWRDLALISGIAGHRHASA